MSKSNEIYQKNIAALREKSPDFIAWWESQTDRRKIELIYTLAGLPNLQIESPEGKKVIIYNHDYPLQAIREELKKRKFFKESVTFLFGLGLGYKAQQILEKMEKGHLLFVIEEDPQILRLALSLHDFSENIGQENIVFCIPEEENIRQRINQHGPRLLNGKISLEMESFAPKISPVYPALYKNCQRFCNTLYLSYNTFVSLSDTFMLNELKNIPKTALGDSTKGFSKGDFINIPAILVATGPSLQKNIHLLKQAKGKAIIIAVAQALRVLLAYDIVPDIICSIDFGKPNYLDLEDVIQDAQIPLLIDSRVYPRIPFEYQSDLIVPVISDDILFQTIDNHQETVGRGKTVAQMCLNLALAMGANPIIFTGQDLALAANSHIAGAVSRTRVELQGNQIIQWYDWGKTTNEAYWVDGVYGGKVLTTKVLMGYLEDFEATIKNFPNRCFIDATEGGALIKGTQIMPLQEVLDQYCQQDHNLPHLLEQVKTPLNPDLKKLIIDLDSVHRLAYKILHINKKLEKPIKIMKKLAPTEKEGAFSESQRKRFKELQSRVNQGFTQISRAINSQRIIRSSLGKVRHVLIQRENRHQAKDSSYKKAKITLRRYEVAYNGFEMIVSRIKKTLDEILPPLKEYYKLTTKEPRGRKQRSDFHFRLGLCLKKMGYLKRAIPEFEQGGENKESLQQLIETYQALEDFTAAQQCLDKLDSDLAAKQKSKIQSSQEKCLDKYLTKARQRSQEDDFVNAIIYSRKVLAIDPESAPAKEILKKSLEQRQEKIYSTQQEVQQLKKESESKQELGRQLTEAKKMVLENAFSEAISTYQKILTYQEHPEAHFGLSRAYQGQKNWEAAIEQLQYLLERYPHKGQLQVDLGNIYLSQGRYHESFQAYQKAIEVDKNFVRLHLKMANICIHLGQIEEAIQHYENYLNLNPGDYHSLVKLGDCYLLLGARDAARLGYQAALRIQPNYSPAMERINRLSL